METGTTVNDLPKAIRDLIPKIRTILVMGKGVRSFELKYHLPASSEEDLIAAAEAMVSSGEAFSHQIGSQTFYILKCKPAA